MNTQLLHYGFLATVKKIKQISFTTQAILKGQISRYPPFVKKFEDQFAKDHGRKMGLTFCNGTSAIEAALFALNIQPGDEVIVPSCTFHASIDPIINLGATPVFVDVQKNNLSLCPRDLSKKITEKTKAVVVVHLFGIPADMKRISTLCEERGLELIEDVSHAHGAIANNKACGSYGRAGAFSLQGAKAVASGEGGIALTDEEELYLRMSLYGHFNRHGEKFNKIKMQGFSEVGLGYKRRMAPLGVGLAEVDRQQLSRVNGMMNTTAQRIDKALGSIKTITIPEIDSDSRRGGFYCGYPFSVNDPSHREPLKTELKKIGIAVNFYPFAFHHKLAVYNLKLREKAMMGELTNPIDPDAVTLPVTEELSQSLLLIRRKHLITLTPGKIQKMAHTIRLITGEVS